MSNLAHIVPSLEEQHGGPSRSVRALCLALAQLGHAVDLYATHPASAETGSAMLAPRLQRHVFSRDWPQRICPSRGLQRALEAAQPDIVHHHALWLRTLHYAHRRAGGKIPLVVSPRGMMSRWAWNHHRFRKTLARLLVHPGALDAVAGWHATSDAEAADIRALGFRQPICVAPNGVVAPTAGDLAAAAAHWRAACPAVATRPVALFYSRFHAKKRVLELIELWAQRAPRDWLLLLVGIPEDYGVEELQQRAAAAGAADRVAVFSGLGRPPPYSVASLFLLPSHNENFGLVIAEALAHGVPALVTDTTPWQALAPRFGACVPWTDYGAALAATTREDAAVRRQRGAAARDWVTSEFAWERSARTLGDFYSSLVTTPR